MGSRRGEGSGGLSLLSGSKNAKSPKARRSLVLGVPEIYDEDMHNNDDDNENDDEEDEGRDMLGKIGSFNGSNPLSSQASHRAVLAFERARDRFTAAVLCHRINISETTLVDSLHGVVSCTKSIVTEKDKIIACATARHERDQQAFAQLLLSVKITLDAADAGIANQQQQLQQLQLLQQGAPELGLGVGKSGSVSHTGPSSLSGLSSNIAAQKKELEALRNEYEQLCKSDACVESALAASSLITRAHRLGAKSSEDTVSRTALNALEAQLAAAKAEEKAAREALEKEKATMNEAFLLLANTCEGRIVEMHRKMNEQTCLVAKQVLSLTNATQQQQEAAAAASTLASSQSVSSNPSASNIFFSKYDIPSVMQNLDLLLLAITSASSTATNAGTTQFSPSNIAATTSPSSSSSSSSASSSASPPSAASLSPSLKKSELPYWVATEPLSAFDDTEGKSPSSPTSSSSSTQPKTPVQPSLQSPAPASKPSSSSSSSTSPRRASMVKGSVSSTQASKPATNTTSSSSSITSTSTATTAAASANASAAITAASDTSSTSGMNTYINNNGKYGTDVSVSSPPFSYATVLQRASDIVQCCNHQLEGSRRVTDELEQVAMYWKQSATNANEALLAAQAKAQDAMAALASNSTNQVAQLMAELEKSREAENVLRAKLAATEAQARTLEGVKNSLQKDLDSSRSETKQAQDELERLKALMEANEAKQSASLEELKKANASLKSLRDQDRTTIAELKQALENAASAPPTKCIHDTMEMVRYPVYFLYTYILAMFSDVFLLFFLMTAHFQYSIPHSRHYRRHSPPHSLPCIAHFCYFF